MSRLALLILFTPLVAFAQGTEKSESEVATVWDLTDLFPSVESWEEALDEVSQGIPKLESFQGRLGESAATLEEALTIRSSLYRKLANVSVYASLKSDENLAESEPRALKQRVSSVGSTLRQNTSWMAPEIISLGADNIEAFIAETSGLAPFDHSLRGTLLRAPHLSLIHI